MTAGGQVLGGYCPPPQFLVLCLLQMSSAISHCPSCELFLLTRLPQHRGLLLPPQPAASTNPPSLKLVFLGCFSWQQVTTIDSFHSCSLRCTHWLVGPRWPPQVRRRVPDQRYGTKDSLQPIRTPPHPKARPLLLTFCWINTLCCESRTALTQFSCLHFWSTGITGVCCQA